MNKYKEEVVTDNFDPNAATTQVATTVGSYKKAALFLTDIIESGSKVLDYGAGLGKGTLAMREVLSPAGIEVESYEPFPERGETPTYTDPNQINEKFDAVVNLNVLNVVPKDIRDAITSHIISVLKPEGVALISTRKWNGDITQAKNFKDGPEEKSMIVLRKKGGETIEVFQKGFDGKELQEYISSFTSREVTALGGKFGANCIMVNPE